MSHNRWLEHHQVKGAHWGVHNGPPYPLDRSISDGKKLVNMSPPNTTLLKKYKGPMYFISSEEFDGQTLKPRVVDNFFTKNGYEDNKTKRISFAPDVGKCLSGLSQNVKGKKFNVYTPDVDGGVDVYKPNTKAVPDSEITQEMWVTEPIKVKKVGSITCTGDTGEDGHKFKYGDNEAELYDWNYEWDTTYTHRNAKKANEIYKTLSDEEKYFLTAEENAPRYINPGDYNKKHSSNVYSIIEQYKDTPVSVIDIWQNEDKIGEVSIAVRNGTEYRHKGYASRALENGLKYFYNNPEMEYLVWGVNAKNRPSIELAKKYGFTFFEDVDGEWHTYVKKKEVKHSMSYNRWLAPDELEHHGVKGQNWGERNGPPYPLDSSKSDGNKLLTKGSGSPQDKKRYKTSEKTAHKRAERKARTDKELERARMMYGKKNISKEELAALRRAKRDIDSHHVTDPEVKELITMDHMDHVDDDTYSVWNSNEKQEKLSKAGKNDTYDLPFIETVQNESWYNDRKRMLKEYSTYLDDPEWYFKRSLPDSAGDDRKYDEALRKPVNVSADRKAIKDRIYDFLDKVLPSTEGQKWGVKNGPPYPVPKDKLQKSFDKNSQTKNASKDAKLKAAKDNGMFDLDYLEAIQNEPWFDQKYDKKRVMKEYSEYLDDPEKYYKNH